MTIIEIRPGNGGKDAEDFTEDLKNAFAASLKNSSYKVKEEPFSSLSRSFVLETNAPLSQLQWLQGQHVVTRIPPGSSARHTSSASVVVRKELVAEAVEINESDLRIDRYRGSGPGGQHRNKVSSNIRILHKPTGIIVTCGDSRSQAENLISAKNDLESRLSRIGEERFLNDVNRSRSAGNDPSRSFTHNYQLGEVIHHDSSQRWDIKKFNKGKWNIIK